jgi:hypothetical protein
LYEKFYFQALKLQWGGQAHHFRVQRGCIIPTVSECTTIAQEEMHGRLRELSQEQGMKVILAGDGQYDSPGSCAKTCTYTMAVAGLEGMVSTEQHDQPGLVRMKTFLPSG